MKISKVMLGLMMTFVIAFGSAFYVNSSVADTNSCDKSDVAAAACGRCGDGYCSKTCGETAKSCPKDCGGEPSTK